MILAVTNDKYEHIVFMADNYKQMSRLTGICYPVISRQCRNITKESRGKYKFVEIEDDEDESR